MVHLSTLIFLTVKTYLETGAEKGDREVIL